MVLFLTGTLLASFTFFEFSCFVSASSASLFHALRPRGSSAVLSPHAQSLVNQTVEWQKATGNQWDLLAAEALLTLVEDVEANGWQSDDCTLDDVYVRREW